MLKYRIKIRTGGNKMTNIAIQPKKSLLSQILAWLKKVFNYSEAESLGWDDPEKTQLIKKIRAIIIKDYPEKLYLETYSEKSLKFRPLAELKNLLANLEKPRPKEPD
jgi:hypothetical protein